MPLLSKSQVVAAVQSALDLANALPGAVMPPPPAQWQLVRSLRLDVTNVHAPDYLYRGVDRYERYRNAKIVRTPAFPYPFTLTNASAGGVAIGKAFPYARYAVKVNGVEWGSYTPAVRRAGVVWSATGMPAGWTMSPAGALAGTAPAGNGLFFTITVKATAAGSPVVTRAMVLYVNSVPSANVEFNATPGSAFSRNFAITGLERAGVMDCTVPAGTPDTWYVGDLYGFDAGGAATLLNAGWIGVNLTGALKDDPNIPRTTGGFCWVHPEADAVADPITHLPIIPSQPGLHALALMPKALAEPLAYPLPRRPTPVPFNTAVSAALLHRENITVPYDSEHLDNWRTCYTHDGVAVSDQLQGYFPEQWMEAPPQRSHIDGKRGQCMTLAALNIIPRHAGGFDYTDVCGDRHVDWMGTVTTRFGIRHKQPRYSGYNDLPAYYEPPDINDPNVEIVGESGWPASVPRAQRFPWEAWNGAYDLRTVAIDNTRPKIMVSGNLEFQHKTHIDKFWADRFGRIVKTTFVGNADGYNVDANGVVTDPVSGAVVDLFALAPTHQLWVTGLGDPWGLVCDNGVIGVTDRAKHRISQYSADTPQTLIRHIFDNPNGARFGVMGPRRRFSVSATVDSWSAANAAAARVDACVAPEGLYSYLDANGDLIYGWGAYAQGEGREVNTRTLAWWVTCRPFVSYGGKSWFIDPKRCDGTTGPLGMIGTTTFSEAVTTAGGWGRPEFFLPTPGPASATDPTRLSNSVPYNWSGGTLAQVFRGRGGRTAGCGYGMTFGWGGAGPGRIIVSSSQAGFDEWTLADPAAPLPDEIASARGFAYLKTNHLQLRYGWNCLEGGEPRPWGLNADLDKYMAQNGVPAGG
jgi:hypothetical protein